MNKVITRTRQIKKPTVVRYAIDVLDVAVKILNQYPNTEERQEFQDQIIDLYQAIKAAKK